MADLTNQNIRDILTFLGYLTLRNLHSKGNQMAGNYIFKDNNGVVIASKQRSRGRPPVGTHVSMDGNDVIINGCLPGDQEPNQKSKFRKINVDGFDIWQPYGHTDIKNKNHVSIEEAVSFDKDEQFVTSYMDIRKLHI